MNFIKSVTSSTPWLIFKVLSTIVITALGFQTIKISFFGYFVLGAEVFLKWNFWANTGLALVIMGFSVVLAISTWNDIKNRFARKE